MKNTKTRISLLLTALTMLLLASESPAAAWRDYIPFFGRQRTPETLIITGNYAKSRLLAEVTQLRGKATILLIVQDADGEQAFFMEHYPDAQLIPRDQLIDFLAVLSPARIIVLGDRQYVPNRYADLVRSRYPLVMITGEDWIKNAKAVASAVGDRRLVEQYRRYLANLLDEQIKRSDFSDQIPMRDRIIVP